MPRDALIDRPWWVAEWIPHLGDERSIDRLRRVVWLVLGASLLAFVVRGADEPADPFLAPVPSTVTTAAP